MTGRLKKWMRRVQPHGGSLMVTIPSVLLAKYGIRSGDYVLLQEQEGTITVSLFDPQIQASFRSIEGSAARARPGHSQAKIKYRSLGTPQDSSN